MKDLQYFLDLGLSEEAAKKALKDYQADVEAASNVAVDNKNKILSEKKQLQEQLEEKLKILEQFEARQKEVEAKAKNDEVAALFAAGEIDKAKEMLKSNILKEHELSLNNYKKEVTEKEQNLLSQLKEKDSQIYDFMFDRDFQKIAMENKFFKKSEGSLEMLRSLAKEQFDFKDGNFVYKKEAELIDGEKVTPQNWLDGVVRKRYDFLFDKPQGADVKPSYSSDSQNGKLSSEEYAKLSTSEKAQAERDGRL